jgi:hypothetical protein
MDATPPRLPPRFSLLNLLLLTALVATSLTTALLWREVGPLRAEVYNLRQETGQLTVVDPTKIYVTAIQTLDEDTWRWRVYLPKGVDYDLHTLIGTIRGRTSNTSQSEWFKQCGYSCGTRNLIAGEFTITAALRPESGQPGKWLVKTVCRNEATPHTTYGGTCGRDGMDWMDDARMRSAIEGDAQLAAQHGFDASRGLNLLTIRRCTITQNAGGWSVQYPNSTIDNDGVAVWIVPRKP